MKITIDVSDVMRKIPQIIADAQADVEALTQKVALDIYADLLMTTPVDTGAARQGWQLDNGPGGAMEISNSVPYIGKLNDGHSKQAPTGFIEAAVDRHTK
ncbi:MAG: hypothetical protein ACSLE1_15725 [Sphingobium sp.]